MGMTELRWVKPPHQDRSRDTHERIVEAALRLLGKGRAFDDITIAELVADAGSSVGSFYQRFPDKAALLHALHVELCAQGNATIETVLTGDAWDGASLEVLVKSFVTFAVGVYRDQRGLRRAALLVSGSDPAFRDRAVALSRATCDAVTRLLHRRYPRRDRRTLRMLVDVCHRMVYGVLDQDLLFLDEPPTGHALVEDELARELTSACTAYLRSRLS